VSSFRRIVSSRANAAHSTGPKTAAGKRRSSQNALRHGFRSQRPPVILENESSHDFDTLLQDHVSQFQPRDPRERACVDRMATAQWRKRRLRTIENRMWRDALASEPPADEFHNEIDRSAAAFSTLCCTPGFAVLSRYDGALQQSFQHAFRDLRSLRTPDVVPANRDPRGKVVSQFVAQLNPGCRVPTCQEPCDIRIASRCGGAGPLANSMRSGVRSLRAHRICTNEPTLFLSYARGHAALAAFGQPAPSERPMHRMESQVEKRPSRHGQQIPSPLPLHQRQGDQRARCRRQLRSCTPRRSRAP